MPNAYPASLPKLPNLANQGTSGNTKRSRTSVELERCPGCRIANGSTCASAPVPLSYAATPESCGSCDTP
eukprot:10345604-Heterocapsa_arctica.AAC.1